MICSSGADSTSTTMVMRLKRSSSVGATASEKMLNPRRENRPATRASTPALFSTSTVTMWCLAPPLALVGAITAPLRPRSGRR